MDRARELTESIERIIDAKLDILIENNRLEQSVGGSAYKRTRVEHLEVCRRDLTASLHEITRWFQEGS